MSELRDGDPGILGSPCQKSNRVPQKPARRPSLFTQGSTERCMLSLESVDRLPLRHDRRRARGLIRVALRGVALAGAEWDRHVHCA